MKKALIHILVLAMFVSAAGMAAGDEISDLKQRIELLEKKTDELAVKQEHTDKHISHMEEAIPTRIGALSIAGGITVIIQGTEGNDGNNPPGEDVLDGSFSMDLEIDAAIGKNAEAFLLMEAGGGDGLEGDEVRSFWGVNDDAGNSGSSLEVSEAWYEHRLLDGHLKFTAGKLDITNYFDINEMANDETTQFLAPGFVNNPAVDFPDNTIGMRVSYDLRDFLTISLGWQDGDADYEDIFEDSFIILEAGVSQAFGGMDGNYRLYAWLNKAEHAELSNPANNDEAGWGTGASVDQQLTDSIGVFARAGYRDGDVYEFDIAVSAGAELKGELWARPNDTAGIAFGTAMLSDDYEDVQKAQGIDTADEHHFEAYYSFYVNEHVVVTPDMQVVMNAEGDDDSDTVFVFGMRGQVTF